MQRSVAVLSTGVVAATLALFGLTWWFMAEHNASIFGVPLSGASLAYGRVKGAEDLLAAAVLGLALYRGDAGARVCALLLALVVPIGDFAALLSVGRTGASVLAIHLVFIVVMAFSALTFHRARSLS